MANLKIENVYLNETGDTERNVVEERSMRNALPRHCGRN